MDNEGSLYSFFLFYACLKFYIIKILNYKDKKATTSLLLCGGQITLATYVLPFIVGNVLDTFNI